MLLPPVADVPTLPLDRSVLPPLPLLAPLTKLLLLLLLDKEADMLLPPPPPAVLLLTLLTLALLVLLPPLPDDVIDAAELLAVEALENDEREDERLPLSVPTWYSWLARFSALLVLLLPPLLLLLLLLLALVSLCFPPPPPPPPASLPISDPSSVAEVVEPPIEPCVAMSQANHEKGACL